MKSDSVFLIIGEAVKNLSPEFRKTNRSLRK